MFALRRHMRLWAAWTVVSAGVLMANPWSHFGWLELVAVLAPFIMVVERRISQESAFGIGVPAITLLWLAEFWLVDPTTPLVVRLLIAWFVFGAGVMLAARTVNSETQLGAIAGHVAFAPPDAGAFEQFESALRRELGRARRHERPFALLSVAAHSRSIEVGGTGVFRNDLLQDLARNRARLELRDFLRDELHIYSDVAVAGTRVLALVPEVDDAAIEVLVKRLETAATRHFDLGIEIGAGCFPRDAVCADTLIAAADRDRIASKLRSLPERRPRSVAGAPAGLTSDVHG